MKRKLLFTAFILALAACAATAALAQDNGALMDALVKKGVLTDQEAEEIRASLATDNHAAVTQTFAAGKSTTALTFNGRVQAQDAGIDASVEHGADPDKRRHFFLRRVYFGIKATLPANFSIDLNYDFAGDFFDKAFVRWSGDIASLPFNIDAGYRKVNFGSDEYASSGNLKAIERSATTRYFAEENNGRRLAAASYRIGIFADYNPNAFAGKSTGFFAGLAITNPERPLVSLSDGVGFAGDSTNNTVALWLNAGYSAKIKSSSLLFGASAAWLPDQGGFGTSTNSFGRGAGNDLTEAAAFIDFSIGKFQIASEFLYANVEGGAADNSDAKVKGFWIQPAFKLTEKFELVARYSYTDTDGRGIRVSDGVRSAPSVGLTADKLHEYYAGINWYIIGNDLKFQLGYVGAKTAGGKISGGGTSTSETVNGLRAQLQLNF